MKHIMRVKGIGISLSSKKSSHRSAVCSISSCCEMATVLALVVIIVCAQSETGQEAHCPCHQGSSR